MQGAGFKPRPPQKKSVTMLVCSGIEFGFLGLEFESYS